jgi:hypothetical protein
MGVEAGQVPVTFPEKFRRKSTYFWFDNQNWKDVILVSLEILTT